MIAFRCDGDRRVGAGHVARSLQIARAFAASGEPVLFVGAYEGVAAGLLAAVGVATAAPVPGRPLGLPAEVACVVVDSYALGAGDIAPARDAAAVAVIVDGGVAAPADAVLAYHPDAADRVTVPEGAVGVLGAQYAPVPPETAAARRSRGFARALVAVGGGEAGLGLAEEAARALLELDDALEVFVAAPGPRPLTDRRLTWELAQRGLTGLIAWADVAVSAAGSTPYELACAGVPTVLEPVAANQVPVRDVFVARGLAADGVATLADPLVRAALAGAGPRAIDGHGAARARDALIAAFAGRPLPRVLLYRPATVDDAARLLEWRNDQEVRAMSRSRDVIAPADHATWLAEVLADPDRTLLVVEDHGRPVGTVRFDREGAQAEISVALAPEARGAGLGTQILGEATELQLASYPALGRILAEVQRRNLRSIRAFERAGYTLLAEHEASDSVLLVRARAQETDQPPAQEQR